MNWRDLKKLLTSPQELAHWVEGFEPKLAKHVLNYASMIRERELMGIGFQLIEWSDEKVGVSLNERSRTVGTFVTLSEFMIRILLGRHLPMVGSDLTFSSGEIEIEGSAESVKTLKMELVGSEREAWIGASQSAERAERDLVVWLWNKQDQRVGEIRLKGQLNLRMALPAQGPPS